MPDTVTAQYIDFGGRRYEQGAVVTVPEESRDWLLGLGLISAGGDHLGSEQPTGPAMTEAAAAAIAEHGLDAELITGTGSGGRITKGDVDAWLASLDEAEDGDDQDDGGEA